MAKHNIYLDYAAATPLEAPIIKAMKPYLSDFFYNPSSLYEPARQVKRDLAEARHTIARILGTNASDIIFTAGATESINLALQSFDTHVISAIDHQAVHAAAGTQAKIVAVDSVGRLDMSALREAIDDSTQIVSIGYVNNEIGTIQHMQEIACLVKEVRRHRPPDTPLWLHTDASQAPGIVDLNVERLGVDMMTLNAAKIYGPKQVGLLWARPQVHLNPLIRGGGQEKGRRSGTENVAGVIGFAAALERAEKKRAQETKRFNQLRHRCKKTLLDAFPDCVISGPSKHVAAHIFHVSFPDIDAERVVFALEAQGVYVATGAACAANTDKRSHVLDAIGLDASLQQGSIRLSFGRPTSEKDVATALRAIIDCVKQEYNRES